MPRRDLTIIGTVVAGLVLVAVVSWLILRPTHHLDAEGLAKVLKSTGYDIQMHEIPAPNNQGIEYAATGTATSGSARVNFAVIGYEHGSPPLPARLENKPGFYPEWWMPAIRGYDSSGGFEWAKNVRLLTSYDVSLATGQPTRNPHDMGFEMYAALADEVGEEIAP